MLSVWGLRIVGSVLILQQQTLYTYGTILLCETVIRNVKKKRTIFSTILVFFIHFLRFANLQEKMLKANAFLSEENSLLYFAGNRNEKMKAERRKNWRNLISPSLSEKKGKNSWSGRCFFSPVFSCSNSCSTTYSAQEENCKYSKNRTGVRIKWEELLGTL